MFDKKLLLQHIKNQNINEQIGIGTGARLMTQTGPVASAIRSVAQDQAKAGTTGLTTPESDASYVQRELRHQDVIRKSKEKLRRSEQDPISWGRRTPGRGISRAREDVEGTSYFTKGRDERGFPKTDYTFITNRQARENREKYAQWEREDAQKAEDKATRERMQLDALKSVGATDAYKNASPEERTKMLDRAYNLRDVGNQVDTYTGSEERVARTARQENIDRDRRAKIDAMSPQERDAWLDKSLADMDRDQAKRAQEREDRYQQGRKAFQGRGRMTMDDVEAMGDYFAQNRRDRQRISKPILAAARRDLETADRDPIFNRPYGIDNLMKTIQDVGGTEEYKRLTSPRERARNIFRDQGIDPDNPEMVEWERNRRQAQSRQWQLDLEALRRRRNQGTPLPQGFATTPTVAVSSGRF